MRVIGYIVDAFGNVIGTVVENPWGGGAGCLGAIFLCILLSWMGPGTFIGLGLMFVPAVISIIIWVGGLSRLLKGDVVNILLGLLMMLLAAPIAIILSLIITALFNLLVGG